MRDKYIYVESTETPINIVMCSGGKDSSAMLIKMVEDGCDIDKVVFCDTGVEYPEIYEHILKLSKYVGIPFNIIPPRITFDQGFYKKIISGKRKGEIRGFPFSSNPKMCWIRRDIKMKELEKIQTKHNIISYIGFSADEKDRILSSKTNSNMRYPLIEESMTGDDCKQFLLDRGMLPNIYNYVDRTGCWLCPFQQKKCLKFLHQFHPELWDRLKAYESDSPTGFIYHRSLDSYEHEFNRQV